MKRKEDFSVEREKVGFLKMIMIVIVKDCGSALCTYFLIVAHDIRMKYTK